MKLKNEYRMVAKIDDNGVSAEYSMLTYSIWQNTRNIPYILS